MIKLMLFVLYLVLMFISYKKKWINKSQFFQTIVYGFWGAITLTYGIITLQDISKPGINFGSGILFFSSSILVILVGIVSIIWAMLAFPKLRDKATPIKNIKYINNYTIPILLIAPLFISLSLDSSASSIQAKKLNFSSEKEFSEAKKQNIYNIDEFTKYLADKKIKDAIIVAAKAEEDRISAETKAEKDNIAAAEQEKKDSEYTLIVKDSLTNSSDSDIILKFEKNNEFELSVLEEIQSYQNESFQQHRAAMMFRDYGVRLSDFDKLIRPKCSESIDELDRQYKNETGLWKPFSWYKDKDLLESEHKYRENYNKVFFKEHRRQMKKMMRCFHDLSQELPNHSPRPKPKFY